MKLNYSLLASIAVSYLTAASAKQLRGHQRRTATDCADGYTCYEDTSTTGLVWAKQDAIQLWASCEDVCADALGGDYACRSGVTSFTSDVDFSTVADGMGLNCDSGNYQCWGGSSFPEASGLMLVTAGTDATKNCYYPTEATLSCTQMPKGGNCFGERYSVICPCENGSTPSPSAQTTDAPTDAPTATVDEVGFPEPELCDADSALMIFSGHDKVESVYAGAMDITWSPAFVYYIDNDDDSLDKFVDCGDYTYTVIIAETSDDVEVEFSLEMTRDEITAMANSDSTMEVFETQDRSLTLTDLTPGQAYSVLVLAQAENGSESLNRATALVYVSAQDPETKTDFGRMLVMPEPEEGWTVTMSDVSGYISLQVTGGFPDDFLEIQTGDFLTVTGDDGLSEANVKMLQAVSLETNSAGLLTWQCEEKLLSDIFDELDASWDINEETEDSVCVHSLSIYHFTHPFCHSPTLIPFAIDACRMRQLI